MGATIICYGLRYSELIIQMEGNIVFCFIRICIIWNIVNLVHKQPKIL